MFRLISIETKSPVADTRDLLGDEVALRWLEIAESVKDSYTFPELEFAITSGNRLYLIVTGEEDINPIKFSIRGEVSKRYDSIPHIDVTKFEKPMPLVSLFLAQSALMLDITTQLALQYPEYLDPKHTSMTGVSIDFTEDPRRYRWNGASNTVALAPLAKYLAGPELERWEEELCDY